MWCRCSRPAIAANKNLFVLIVRRKKNGGDFFKIIGRDAGKPLCQSLNVGLCVFHIRLNSKHESKINSKFEFRNPKQYQNSNDRNPKRFKDWDFEFKICFEFRALCFWIYIRYINFLSLPCTYSPCQFHPVCSKLPLLSCFLNVHFRCIKKFQNDIIGIARILARRSYKDKNWIET